jgi:hypothetical protein
MDYATALMSGFEISLPAHIFFENHDSSHLDTSFISNYIASEQAASWYSEGYDPDALEAIIRPFHTSPLGLVPKPHSDSLHLVQDMSFPQNNPLIPSVNAGVNSDDFPTEWGMFESTAQLILSLPDGCLVATFDISAAYRLTPIRPSKQNALCISWNDKVYVDRAVMFRLTSSAGVFSSIADMLVAIYGEAGFKAIKKWVDNFFMIRFPHKSWMEQEFMELTGAIGVPWSLKKTRPLASTQRYIGFLWNLDARTAALPEEKVWAARALLRKWLTKGSVFLAHDAASAHGKLVHISCIYKLIHPFLRSIAHFAQSFSSGRAKLTPPTAVTADMSWVDFIVSISPNEIPLAHPDVDSPTIKPNIEAYTPQNSENGSYVVVR